MRSLFAVLALLLVSCASKTGAEPTDLDAIDVGDGLALAPTRDALRSFATSGAHRAFIGEPAPVDRSSAHRDNRIFYNDTYLEARRSETFPMPRGALAVKEIYDDDALEGYAIALKIEDGDAPDTWLWWEAFAPDFDADAFGIAVPLCENCHKGAARRDRSWVESVP